VSLASNAPRLAPIGSILPASAPARFWRPKLARPQPCSGKTRAHAAPRARYSAAVSRGVQHLVTQPRHLLHQSSGPATTFGSRQRKMLHTHKLCAPLWELFKAGEGLSHRTLRAGGAPTQSHFGKVLPWAIGGHRSDNRLGQACVNTAARQAAAFPSEIFDSAGIVRRQSFQDQRPRSGGAHQATPCPPKYRRRVPADPMTAAKSSITTGHSPGANCPAKNQGILCAHRRGIQASPRRGMHTTEKCHSFAIGRQVIKPRSS